MPLEIVFTPPGSTAAITSFTGKGQPKGPTAVTVSNGTYTFVVGNIHAAQGRRPALFLIESRAGHYFNSDEIKEVRERVDDYMTLQRITERLQS